MAPTSPETTSYLPLVAHVVRQLSTRYPRHVDRAAMWSLGAWGLVAATERHDPGEADFTRRALHLIRTTIVDATRIGAAPARVTDDDDVALGERLGLRPEQVRVLRDAALPPVLPATSPAAAVPGRERVRPATWVPHPAAAVGSPAARVG